MKKAKRILDNHFDAENSVDENAIIQAMKEYAIEAIRADRLRVAENAKTKYVRYDDPKANWHGEDIIDKDSILNLPIQLP